MATKLGTVVTYFVKLLTIKSFDTLIMWLARSRDKNLISTNRLPIATNLAEW